MNDKIDNGGSVFPTVTVEKREFKRNDGLKYIAPVNIHNDGMSLRDYFAAKAMQGIISNFDNIVPYLEENNLKTREEITQKVSEISFDYADAMLLERDK